MMRDLTIAIVSTVCIASVMTLGDWMWASRHLSHRMVFGLLHGAGLCLAMGLAIGVPAGRPIRGAIGGLAIGFVAAASFYVFAPIMGYAAMFVSWMLLWILLALFAASLRRAVSTSALARGVIAAIGSGLAFYAISGMWQHWNPETIDYADHFLRWTIAFLPGFLALHLFSSSSSARASHL
jgi:hypothetical protein